MRPCLSRPSAESHACPSPLRRIFLIAIGAALLLPAAAGADGWIESDAAESTADDIENHEAHTTDPNDITVGSSEPVIVESEDPNDLEVGAEEMDEAGPGNLADHEGHSEALQDLEMDAPDRGYEEIYDGLGEEDPDTLLSADQVVAKRHLQRAQAEAKEARDVYGKMMDNDYPRGAARERIAHRRDTTMAALEDARKDYKEAMGMSD